MELDASTLKVRTIAMMGRQGSGKGMQAKMLGETTGFRIFSSGSRYREISKQDTFLGRKVDGIIDEGILMPHWFSSYLFMHELLKLEKEDGIIFEGPGRKVEEMQMFHEVNEWLERPYVAFYLDLPEDVAVVRLQERAKIEKREDDDIEGIRMRFREYEKHTLPSINFLREQGTLIEINGDQTPEEVHTDVMKEFERLNS